MGQERFGVIPSVMQFGYRTLREHGANARRRISRLAHAEGGKRRGGGGGGGAEGVGEGGKHRRRGRRRAETRGEDKLKIKIPFET
jgi:hypothetical protein